MSSTLRWPLADFVIGIETGKPTQPDFRNALQTQKVRDAVIDSANTGNPLTPRGNLPRRGEHAF